MNERAYTKLMRSSGSANPIVIILLAVVMALGIVLSIHLAPYGQRASLPVGQSQTATPIDTSGWKVFADSKSQITFKYPPDWTFSDNCNDKIMLLNCVWSPDFQPDFLDTSWESTKTGAFMGMRFNRSQTPYSGAYFDDYLNRASCQSFPGACSFVTIAGKQALQIQRQTQSVVTSEIEAVQISGTTFFSITLNNSVANAEIMHPLFATILSTFSFSVQSSTS